MRYKLAEMSLIEVKFLLVRVTCKLNCNQHTFEFTLVVYLLHK